MDHLRTGFVGQVDVFTKCSPTYYLIENAREFEKSQSGLSQLFGCRHGDATNPGRSELANVLAQSPKPPGKHALVCTLHLPFSCTQVRV